MTRVEISSIPINTPSQLLLVCRNNSTLCPTQWANFSEQYRFHGHISVTSPSTPQITTWITAATLPPQRTFGPAVVANSLVPVAYMKASAHLLVDNRLAGSINMEPSALNYLPLRFPPDPETNIRRPDYWISNGETSVNITGTGIGNGQATFIVDPGGQVGGHERWMFPITSTLLCRSV